MSQDYISAYKSVIRNYQKEMKLYIFTLLLRPSGHNKREGFALKLESGQIQQNASVIQGTKFACSLLRSKCHMPTKYIMIGFWWKIQLDFKP